MSNKQEIFDSIDDFFANATSTDFLEKAQREMNIASWKEIYSREYMVPGLCSAEEYDSIPASTYRADEHCRAQETAWLMTQVVGDEKDMPDFY